MVIFISSFRPVLQIQYLGRFLTGPISGFHPDIQSGIRPDIKRRIRPYQSGWIPGLTLGRITGQFDFHLLLKNLHLVWIMLVVVKMVDELHDVVCLEAAALAVELLRPPVRQVLRLKVLSDHMA